MKTSEKAVRLMGEGIKESFIVLQSQKNRKTHDMKFMKTKKFMKSKFAQKRRI